MLRLLVAVSSLLWLAPVAACDSSPGAGSPERVFAVIGGESFALEVAADSASRQRGLSGRSEIPRSAGMLFVLSRPQPMTMVMRDCPVPIDVAFLDEQGVVVAVHEMQPDPPREPGESPWQYESRLRPYPSGVPVRFAIEVAGGRLRALGVGPGDRIPLDAEMLVRAAR